MREIATVVVELRRAVGRHEAHDEAGRQRGRAQVTGRAVEVPDAVGLGASVAIGAALALPRLMLVLVMPKMLGCRVCLVSAIARRRTPDSLERQKHEQQDEDEASHSVQMEDLLTEGLYWQP